MLILLQIVLFAIFINTVINATIVSASNINIHPAFVVFGPFPLTLYKRGVVEKDSEEDMLDKALGGQAKPSTIVVDMLIAEIYKNLGMPETFRGQKVHYEGYLYIEERYAGTWARRCHIGDLYFSEAEDIKIHKALQKAKVLRIKKEQNEAESARQMAAINIIEESLCGTSTKSLTDESHAKSQQILPPIYLRNSEGVPTYSIHLKSGETLSKKYPMP